LRIAIDSRNIKNKPGGKLSDMSPSLAFGRRRWWQQRRRRRPTITFALLAALLFLRCASAMNGDKGKIHIVLAVACDSEKKTAPGEAEKEGAKCRLVFLFSMLCFSPCSVRVPSSKLPRPRPPTTTLSHPRKTQTTPIAPSLAKARRLQAWRQRYSWYVQREEDTE